MLILIDSSCMVHSTFSSKWVPMPKNWLTGSLFAILFVMECDAVAVRISPFPGVCVQTELFSLLLFFCCDFLALSLSLSTSCLSRFWAIFFHSSDAAAAPQGY